MSLALSPMSHELTIELDRAAARATRISPSLLVVSVILATTLARFLASLAVGMGYGESYYYACALRPSWSYIDQPPMTSWLARWAMPYAEAHPSLALRIPFILLFAGSTWLLYRFTARLFGTWAGVWAAIVLNLSPVFTLSVGTFLQCDGPLVFFWLATAAALGAILFPTREELRSDDRASAERRWWMIAGLSLGLAMLSKYHAVFLGVGTLAYLVTVPGDRPWLKRWEPYVAAALALALFTPVLWWNAQNEWISFVWQGRRGVQSAGLRLDWLLRSLGGQALWILPWIWGPLIWELVVGTWAGPRDRARWFITCLAIGPIVLFTAVSAYAPIGFHFHWQAPGYLMLFAPLGWTVATRLARGGKVTQYWLAGNIAFAVLALVFVTTHASTGWWSRLGPQWLSAKFGEPDDPTLECLDFTPLEGYMREHGFADRKDLFVFTNRWFQAGKVDYALKGSMPVLCFNDQDPRAFAYWNDSASRIGQDGILVSTKKFLDRPEDWYRGYFESIEPLGQVPLYRGGRVEDQLVLYYCRGLKTPFRTDYR